MGEAERNAERLFAGWGDRLSRRELLRRAGRGSMYVGIGAFLAACGVGGQDEEEVAEPEEGAPEGLPPLSGELAIANWPLYIDRAGGPSPTIVSFREEFGIDTEYKTVINDNEEFFGTIREPLAQGQPTGWDVIVVTDWLIAKMIRLGFLEQVDHSALPNFEANAGEKFRDPGYDPGNVHSIPWAAGMTGIGYDVSLTGRDLTSVEDLFDPAFAGKVGMFKEMQDTWGLILLSLGVEPTNATIADLEKAQQKLIKQREDGIVRGYYGNDYADQLATGSLWVSMAWSGDVFALQLDNPNLRFILPEEGAMRWTDNMAIPKGAEHPTDAHEFMNFVYRPRIATNITEWVWYESPVAVVQEMVLQDAEEASGEDRELLLELGNSPLVFPTAETNAQTHPYKVLEEEEEQIWRELFQEASQG